MTRRAWVAAVTLAGCGKKNPKTEDFGPPKNKYPIRGVVLRLRPAEGIAVIKHEKIEGWMEAMTMEFRVPEEKEFAKLREGAVVEGTVHTNDSFFWLAEVK
jgi:Cu/Ag efflux protein CusF